MNQNSDNRRPKLIQVMPPPLFQEIEVKGRKTYWHVVIRDRQSADSIHFECHQPGWSEADIVKAAGQELAGGGGTVAVQRVKKDIPVSLHIYAVRYAFGQWHIWRERPAVPGNRIGILVEPPFKPVIPGTTYEVYRVGKRYNPVTGQWIALADAVAYVPGLKEPLPIWDYKTLMSLTEAYARQLGYDLTIDNLATL